MSSKIIINFCPTGMVPLKNHTPHVPISPMEIIEQTHEAYEIGITIAHLHAREEDGTPTYKKSIYQEIFEGVRKYCPDLIICGSSSGRNFPEFEKRSEVIELRPDMCSLTLSSLNFAKHYLRHSHGSHRVGEPPPIAVKHRQRVQIHIAIAHSCLPSEGSCVDPEIAMRHLNALWPSCCAAGVVDGGSCVFVWLPRCCMQVVSVEQFVGLCADDEFLRSCDRSERLFEFWVNEQQGGP